MTTYKSPENITTVMEIFRYNNDIAGGYMFGIGILISVFLVISMYLKTSGEKMGDALAVAGFTSSIISVCLLMGGLINGKIFGTTLVIFGFFLIYSYYSKS